MKTLQFPILYREFLFRMIDRELLSLSAQGDAAKLLGRLAAILVLISIPFTFLVIAIGDSRLPTRELLASARGPEHSLIATTMLIVGIFAVLSWNSAYPERRDIFVLAPLPVRPSTIFLAKITALAVALSVTVVIFNSAPGLLLPVALAPHSATPLDLLLSLSFYRTLIAWWITLFAAGAFVFCCVLLVQACATQLPQHVSLRLSAFLQLAAFCFFLTAYFLEPAVAPWSPAYWFVDLFQQLSGFPGPVALADRAWIAFASVSIAAGAAFLLSYFRILRKIAEQPDISPGSRRPTWLPRFGDPVTTAVAHFCIRTLSRSRQHRLLLAFYAGIGFAIAILFLKTPLAQQLSAPSAGQQWHHPTLPLLASSLVLLFAWILGMRIAFALPLELRANWIFQITQIHPPAAYRAAAHRAAYLLALTPVLSVSSLVFFSLWPWRQAVEHLLILVLLGTIFVEWWLSGFQKIPFACSYLPGKSNLHITFLLCLLLGLNATLWASELERRALSDALQYRWILAVLSAAALFVWKRRTHAAFDAKIQFEEEMPPAITTLGL